MLVRDVRQRDYPSESVLRSTVPKVDSGQWLYADHAKRTHLFDPLPSYRAVGHERRS